MIVLHLFMSTLIFTSSATTFVYHLSGSRCNSDALTKKENFQGIHPGSLSEAACRARCEQDPQCDYYQTLNHLAYASGWPRMCQLYRNAYCDPDKLVKDSPWFEIYIKASGIPPVVPVTSGPPLTASCSSQPLDYCLKVSWEGGNSPYAPAAVLWRLADVQNGEPVFVKDGRETEGNGALGFHPNFNRGSLLAGYCAGRTWDAVVLDRYPALPHIVGGTFNWGIAGSCTGTETADILEVLRGQRDSITTAFRARTNSYHADHRDVKIEVVRDVMQCGGRFYSDALFGKSESEQCAIMEAVLPSMPASPSSSPTKEPTKNPTLTPSANPTREPTLDPTRDPTINPTKEPTKNPTMNPSANPTKEPSNNPTVNPTKMPTASPSPFPTAADFIMKIKAFHGKPKDILDSDKIQAQPDVDVELYGFEQKLTPINGVRPLLKMTHLGVGYCTSGFYAGWDGKGIDSQEACNQVCLTEQQCTYAAFFAGETCSRYNGNSCTLNSDTTHTTYAKQSNSDVGTWQLQYTNEQRKCDADLIQTIYSANTETLCKSECVANAGCSGIFFITDSGTDKHCLLYTHCDKLTDATWRGDTWRLTRL